MNKVITINLNGIAYQLEESGYDALREYLDNAARRLGNNPDKDEIIADIEQAIGDKFRAVLGANKTVVITKEVLAVIAAMGPVEDASTDGPAAGPAAAATRPAAEGAAQTDAGAGSPRPVRRLYRIHEGAMVAGVCNGLGAHFGIDPTFVRIGFVVLTFLWGAGFLVYLLMALVVPLATPPAEKAAATGAAATAQEFIRRAKAGYYEGFKTFHDKEAHRAWKRRYKEEMRGWKRNFQRSMHESARAMQENAHQWQQNWQQHGGAHPPWLFGAVFLAPILSLVLLGLAIALFYSIFTLVAHGNVFGLALPLGIPLWLGILGLLVIFHLVSWPVKAARWDCYRGGPWGHGHYGPGPLAGLVWLSLLVIFVWWLDHSVPGFHDWLQTVPDALRHAADAVREWWHNK